jgi:hypothetical protein
MKPLYRYGIIALCFVVFFVLAPVLVVYTTGEVYDFGTHRFVETGILVASTDPSGAQIFLNGKLAGTTPARIRFLAPGDYDVKITKSGYAEWDKRLNVRPQFTTFVNPNIGALYLYRSQPIERAVAGNVQNFVATGDTFAYATPNTVVVAAVADPGAKIEYSAPAGTDFTGSTLTSSPNGIYLLVRTATTAAVLDLGTKKFTALGALAGSVQVTDSGNLYWLNGTTLNQVLWQASPAVVKPLLSNVLAFTVNGQGVYAIQKNATGSSLTFLQLPALQPATLRADLPNWLNATLYVNTQNQIFIIGDGALYAVNSGLGRVADYVQTVKFYEQYGKVLFATGNEVDLYDTYAGSSQLVARTSSVITGAQATPGTGTVFFIGDGKLQGIEIDARDHQNTYTFVQVASAGATFAVSDDAKYVVLLDGTELTQLQIR